MPIIPDPAREYRAAQLRTAITEMANRAEAAGYNCGRALAQGGDWRRHNQASTRRLRALARLVDALAKVVTR